MRVWVLTRLAVKCGCCSRRIVVGEPLCRIVLTDTLVKIRCADCAGEPVPSLVSLDGGDLSLPVMRRLGLLPLDER
jgi:hypothetical protein